MKTNPLSALSLDELDHVSGGFELEADHWRDRGYGDWLDQNYGPGAGDATPDTVFESAPDDNGVQQGGLAVG